MDSNTHLSHWDEDTSEAFLEYGKYFVPARVQQMHIMVEMLKGVHQLEVLLELCCGEGLLAELILEQTPVKHYMGLDGSSLMLEKARLRLSRFGDRVSLDLFELADRSWRKLELPLQGVVSSLAIHHLDGKGKRRLYRDVHALLDQPGIFIIADMVEPVTAPGRQVAADAWDEVVRTRSVELNGNTAGSDFFQREHWNTYRYADADDIDHPSPLFDQLKWLERAGFTKIDVHFLQAGQAVFSAWKQDEKV